MYPTLQRTATHCNTTHCNNALQQRTATRKTTGLSSTHFAHWDTHESCHTRMSYILNIRTSHFLLTHISWHDSFMCGVWLIHMWDIHVWDVTHSHVYIYMAWDVRTYVYSEHSKREYYEAHKDSWDWQDWGLTLEALPPRGGGSAGCPKKDKRRARGGSRDQNTQIYLYK